MAEETLSEKLARHCAGLHYEEIPASVVDAAKLHILDSLGCMLAGSRMEPGRLAYDLALALAVGSTGSTSTLFGTSQRVGYLEAVQAMSTAAHCGELDDIHGGAGTCIGAMVVPAMLATAERFGGNGQRLMEAAVAGYETIARVGLAIEAPALFARGWWPSTICGAIGVAAAGAKLLSWPADKTVNALGIASLLSGGMLTGGNEGATARHLAFGHAAQNGVLALLAAEQGLTGPKRAFEDPRGFCLTFCAKPGWEILEDSERFYLPEVAFKPYPCARQLHAGVEALVTMVRRQSIAASSIQAIELFVPTENAAMLDRPAAPASHAAAVGSGQYVMAVTALRGKLDLESFDDEWLRDHQVWELMSKVKVVGDAELSRHFPKNWPGRVSMKLSDGRSFAHEVLVAKGEAGNPLTREELEEKFLSLAAPVLRENRAQRVMRVVRALEKTQTPRPLLAALQLVK